MSKVKVTDKGQVEELFLEHNYHILLVIFISFGADVIRQKSHHQECKCSSHYEPCKVILHILTLTFDSKVILMI